MSIFQEKYLLACTAFKNISNLLENQIFGPTLKTVSVKTRIAFLKIQLKPKPTVLTRQHVIFAKFKLVSPSDTCSWC